MQNEQVPSLLVTGFGVPQIILQKDGEMRKILLDQPEMGLFFLLWEFGQRHISQVRRSLRTVHPRVGTNPFMSVVNSLGDKLEVDLTAHPLGEGIFQIPSEIVCRYDEYDVARFLRLCRPLPRNSSGQIILATPQHIQRAANAIGLYKGPYLEKTSVYWVGFQRQQLHGLAVKVVKALLQHRPEYYPKAVEIGAVA